MWPGAAHIRRPPEPHSGWPAGCKEHVNTLANGTLAQGLCKMAFSGTAGADDEHGCVFRDVPPGGQLMHERSVHVGQLVEVEGVQRLGGTKRRPAQPGAVFLLFAPGNLVFEADEGSDPRPAASDNSYTSSSRLLTEKQRPSLYTGAMFTQGLMV